jgi:hypothetical protein
MIFNKFHNIQIVFIICFMKYVCMYCDEKSVSLLKELNA